MSKSMLDYQVLGPAFDEVVAHQQVAHQAAMAQVRANLLTPPPARAPRGAWWWIALAPAMAAAALVVGWWWLAAQHLSYTVDGREQPADLWISADQRDTVLAFSDGTEVVFHRGTRGRVTDTGSDEASVLIEQGQVSVGAPDHEDTRWTIDAGPYALRASNARFELSWSPDVPQLRVEIEHGQAELSGPSLEPPQVLRSGEVLELTRGQLVIRRALETPSPAARALEPEASAAARLAEEDEVDDDQTPTPPAAPSMREPDRSRRPPGPASRIRSETWREAAAREDYDASFSMVEPRLEALFDTLGRADLLRLADVARFSGHPDAAVRALTRFRKRFPRHRDAATAAYTLGHIAASGRSREDLQHAARWFTTAIEERPRGPLHRSALARLIKSYERLGDLEASRKASQAYLERYPEGPHVELAQRVLSR